MIFVMKDTIKNNFARNLKYYRTQNHMSQEKLAKKMNVTHQAISMYEQGKRECNFDTLIMFAELFEVGIDELIL